MKENMHTAERISVAHWLRMGAMIIYCSTAVPLSWGVEEENSSTWNFENIGSQMAAEQTHVPVQASSLTTRMRQLRQEHPNLLSPQEESVSAPMPRQEEGGSTGQEIESVHTLSVPSNVSRVSVPTIATRESQRAGSEAGITILSTASSNLPSEEGAMSRPALPAVAVPMPQQGAISVAPNEMETVSSLGDPIQALGGLAIHNAAPPAALPTIREIPTPKRVGLCPVGPKCTGKSVLVNMAAMLEAYLNEEELEALDGWYDAQYLDYSDRQNPFTEESGTGIPPLPEALYSVLMRFVSAESLQDALQEDHGMRQLLDLPDEIRTLIGDFLGNQNLSIELNRLRRSILMPALRLARYHYESQWGVLDPSQVNTLYADEMQPYPVWDLVVGNRPGWNLRNRNNETHDHQQLSLMEEVKERIQPNADLVQNENDAIAAARVRWSCSTHLLFQLPAKAIVAASAPNEWGDVHLTDERTKEVIQAIQYANVNSSLPILLAVSYASEKAEVLPDVEQVVLWMGRWGVRVDNRHIFFFEFGGVLDIRIDNQASLNKFNQLLEPGEDNADVMERYVSARGEERSTMLAGITPRLPQLITALRLRFAKNLAMTHKLLKRIHALNNQRGDESRREAHTMYGTVLEGGIRVADAAKLSPRVTFNKATRQLAGSDNLDTNQIHFIRLFEADNGGREPLSYGANLRHNARGLAYDELFDVERDIPEGLRNSYLWEPRRTVLEEVRDGMIVRTHGTLTTIEHPGYWLFFNFGRIESIETKQSRIRNFEEASVAAHNTLSALQAINETPWREGQVGWLVLNTDLCAGEVENKQVHEEQRDRIRQARTHNTCEMIGRITGTHCTSEKLNTSSFVIPREGYQCDVRETSINNNGNAEMQQTHWVYPRSVDRGRFASYLNRNNL